MAYSDAARQVTDSHQPGSHFQLLANSRKNTAQLNYSNSLKCSTWAKCLGPTKKV